MSASNRMEHVLIMADKITMYTIAGAMESAKSADKAREIEDT